MPDMPTMQTMPTLCNYRKTRIYLNKCREILMKIRFCGVITLGGRCKCYHVAMVYVVLHVFLILYMKLY